MAPETAPSYFLESLLWNVPDGVSATSRPRTGVVSGWTRSSRLGKMEFPNRMGKLFGNTSDTSWNQDSARIMCDVCSVIRRPPPIARRARPGRLRAGGPGPHASRRCTGCARR